MEKEYTLVVQLTKNLDEEEFAKVKSIIQSQINSGGLIVLPSIVEFKAMEEGHIIMPEEYNEREIPKSFI